jgi:HK97 family phage portal protein
MDKFPIFDKEKYSNLLEKTKHLDESNTLFGQTALGNNILRNAGASQYSSASQLLYVTTSSSTQAGRLVDMSVLSRNSTIMACVGAKARALAQLPIKIMLKKEDGTLEDAIYSESVGARDKTKAKSVLGLLTNPNNFQSQYEFWYQWCMWYELSGEAFTVLWRKDRNESLQTPLEMYVLDSTLITAQITEARYPAYRLSTPSYGFNKDEPLSSQEIIHIKEAAWQGSAGFNKGILAAELVALDQDIDLYANFIMQNGAKPTGMFTTTQVIPDNKFKEIAARLKEAWSSMTGSRTTDPSKPGQSMLLDNGMTYTPLEMLTLQDADAAALKEQTMKRICGLFGVPPAMISIGESSYNNTQSMLDEFYKSTMYPTLVNIQQKLKASLLKGYPNLCIEFQTSNFLKGAPLDQMNYVVAAVNNGIMTPNEAREYLGTEKIEGADKLKDTAKPATPIAGTSPQDTGGGGNTSSVGKTGQAGKA